MKQFTHEKFIADHPEIVIADLPETLQNKLKKWDQLKAKVEAMGDVPQKEENTKDLEDMSTLLLSQIEEHVKPAAPPVETPATPAEPKPGDKPVKKKSGNGILWGFLAAAAAGIGISVFMDRKSQK